MFYRFTTTAFWMLLFIINGFAQEPVKLSDSLGSPGQTALPLVNPSAWLQQGYARLNDIFTADFAFYDTTAANKEIANAGTIFQLQQNNFIANADLLNIRTIYDMKMEVSGIITQIEQQRKGIRKINDLLVSQTIELEKIKFEINQFNASAGSLLLLSYKGEVNKLTTRVQDAEDLIKQKIIPYTAYESRLNQLFNDAFIFQNQLNSVLQKKETSQTRQELPAIWKASPEVYHKTFLQSLGATIKHTYEATIYYTKSSFLTLIIFRILVFLLCLIPLRIFKDKEKKEKILLENELIYLENYPKLASGIMGIALAPFIFQHAPHAFLDFIFMSLTLSVAFLVLKKYPQINRPVFILLVGAFLLLYLTNFLIIPTFQGRIFFSLSILLLIPLYKLYREIRRYQLQQEKMIRGLFLFFSVHLVVGWLGVLLGYYTLGKSFILSGYNVLILAMILNIATFTLFDYLTVLGYLNNERDNTFKVRSQFIVNNLKPYLFYFNIFFIVITYLININLYDPLMQVIRNFLETPRNVGEYTFNLQSVFLFLLCVFGAFLLSSLISGGFEQTENQGHPEKRNRFGSYLMLLKFLIICAGFLVGIMASGIPLNEFAIVAGALGVGIGFGLQHIIANIVSGLIIVFERPYVVGDFLEFGNNSGKVKEIGLRATRLSTGDGGDLLIPNEKMLSDNVKNMTFSDPYIMITLTVNTSQEADPEKVIQLIRQYIENQQETVNKEKIKVLLTEITNDAFIFTIRFMTGNIANASAVKGNTMVAINKIFSEKNIDYPDKTFIVKQA